MATRVINRTAKQTRGLIRSLNRSQVRDDKSPAVVRRARTYKEPTICGLCGAVYTRRTWRRGRKLDERMIAQSEWKTCPACEQVGRTEGQGRVMIRGVTDEDKAVLIRRRIQNVAQRAGYTQPQRKISSISEEADGLEVITTSQKLAHRMARELKKLFGGSVTYNWNDDGAMDATWRCVSSKRSRRASRK